MFSTKTRGKVSRKKTGRLVRALIDRLGFACPDFDIHSALSAVGFICVYDEFARKKTGRPKPYARVCRYRHPKTGTQIEVGYERLLPWMPEARVVLVANDLTGLRRKEVNRILDALPKTRLLFVEIAFDFESASGVGRKFVLCHGRFGKSQVRTSRRHPDSLWYGSRRSAKFVRSYPKPGVANFRVELELHRGFLRKNGIASIVHLPLLLHILIPDHICFYRVDEDSFQKFASKHLRHSASIFRIVTANHEPLGQRLRVFREKFGLKNLQRQLIPHPVNNSIFNALRIWARKWYGDAQ